MMMTLNEMLEHDATLVNIPVGGLPDGIDRDLVKSYILMECGECVPRYQNPETYRSMNTLFYRTHQKEFLHLLKVANVDYSPIENTDRYTSISDSTTEDESGTNEKTTSQTTGGERNETLSTTTSGTTSNTQTHENGIEDTVTESGTTSGTDTLTHNTTKATSDSTTETPGTTTNTTKETKVSADNEATYAPEQKEETTEGHTGTNTTAATGSETLTGTDSTQNSETVSNTTTTSHTGEETVTDAGTSQNSGQSTTHSETSGTASGTESGTDTREKTITFEHTEHTHGNIGVTQNSELIHNEVYNVVLEGLINIYKMIAIMYDDFMMLGVY